MLLDISRALKNPGQSYPFSGALSLEAMDVLDDPVRFEGVAIDGSFTGAVESVKVVGRVRAKVHTRCALCLDPVAFDLDAPLAEVFTRTVDPEDPDQRPLNGYAVDLTDPAKDALLLALPMRALCRPDCGGLCPVCGVNLNHRRCTCQEGGERHNPFSALDELLTEDEEV
ncbi:YceD family protein [Bacillota bacterium Meth-B3]